jgi:hypothetical protein
LRGHSASITALAFSPDSGWLISASRDNTVRFWKVTLDGLIDVARRAAGRNLSSAEWERYFAGQPYRRTFSDLPFDSSVIESLLSQARSLCLRGEGDRAAAAYQQATRCAVENNDVRLCYLACFWGSIDGHASVVLPAGSHAVKSEPTAPWCRDVRGLARAAGGDLQGAREDFAAVVEGLEHAGDYEEHRRKREAWIAKLSMGENPFDEATLRILENEGM